MSFKSAKERVIEYLKGAQEETFNSESLAENIYRGEDVNLKCKAKGVTDVLTDIFLEQETEKFFPGKLLLRERMTNVDIQDDFEEDGIFPGTGTSKTITRKDRIFTYSLVERNERNLQTLYRQWQQFGSERINVFLGSNRKFQHATIEAASELASIVARLFSTYVSQAETMEEYFNISNQKRLSEELFYQADIKKYQELQKTVMESLKALEASKKEMQEQTI